jgi:hypothetical protein
MLKFRFLGSVLFSSLALVALAPASYATVLAPGGSIAVYSDFAAGTFGAVMADTGIQAFVGTDVNGDAFFQGNFRQIVVVDTVTGFVDFLYQVQRTTGEGLDAIGRLTTTNYSIAITDVGICTLCADLIAPLGPTKYAPGSIDRNASGSTLGFQFAPVSDIDDTNESYVLVIRTNAPNWASGSTSIIDGGTANVNSFDPAAPSRVPEPSTFVALASGLLGFGFMRRHRK